MQNQKKTIKALLALLLLTFIWGYNWVVMKQALEFSSPVQLAFLRNFFGALCLFLVLALLRKPIFIKEAPKLICLGILQTTGFTGFLIWALVEGGAGKTAILTFTMPLWVAIMAWPFLKERLSQLQWLSVMICFLGIVFIFDPLHPYSNTFSMILAILSGLSWASAVILVKKINLKYPKLDLLTMTAWQMLWGSIPILIAYLVVYSEPVIWSNYFVGAIIFNIIFANALGWVLWLFALKHLRAGLVSMLALLTPIIGSISAWVELSEVPNSFEKIGIALILIGLMSLIFFQSKRQQT